MPEPPPLYIVMTSAAKMPTSCRSRYRNVAVVETDEQTYPKMISERARGAVRIVQRWDKCHVGKTKRSTYWLAVGVAQALADELNRTHRPLSTQARNLTDG